MNEQILFLELNEVNFEYLTGYAQRGLLPNFAAFLDRHGYAETTSEIDYDHLEPWIQWVTAHTGLTYAEHGVFRLGDIVEHDFEQIWERLAAKGLRVGAISPMNANCPSNDIAFFLPDPWTPTGLVADLMTRRMFGAVVQAVNDNAESKLTLASAINLAVGGAKSASPGNYRQYASYLMAASKKPWQKSIFLDLLLSDIFAASVVKHRPNFATLFLNAAAHIQHHYMFSSSQYAGEMSNPAWYVRADCDPVLDVYQAYDRILGRIARQFPDTRIMLATGLHQDPHPEVTYYWRLKGHDQFLLSIGAKFKAIEPRMSRDFLVACHSREEAAQTEALLASAVADDGEKLFEIDNRGDDLFVMLTYRLEITRDTRFCIGDRCFDNLFDNVSFVAIKNGRHNGIGYFADSGSTENLSGTRFGLHELPDRIEQAFALVPAAA